MKISFKELKDIISEEIILLENREDRINELKSYVGKGYFIHFFELSKSSEGKDQGHKFGINPSSDFNTPLGIYGYPLTYTIYGQILDGTLPFALERLYLHIFKPKESANVLYLDKVTSEVESDLINQLENAILNLRGISKEQVKEEIANAYEESMTKAKVKNRGGRFWYVTYEFQRNSLDWNKLFRRMGIDGVVDPGMGIIHDHEPNQCVFFHKLAIDHVDTIENPTPYSDRFKSNLLDKLVKLGRIFEDFSNKILLSYRSVTDGVAQKLIQILKDLFEEYKILYKKYRIQDHIDNFIPQGKWATDSQFRTVESILQPIFIIFKRLKIQATQYWKNMTPEINNEINDLINNINTFVDVKNLHRVWRYINT